MWGGRRRRVISGRSIERDEKNVLISPFCSAPKTHVVAFFLFFFLSESSKKVCGNVFVHFSSVYYNSASK